MRVRVLALAVLLAAGCSGTSTKATPEPSASPTPRTAYADLTPPTSPGIGTFDPLLANRAHVAAQGYLAAQLLEPSSLSGLGDKALATLIQGAAGDPAPARDLTGTTPGGLRFRPLLAKGVTLPAGFATVVRSEYTGDEVSGLSGEQALRVQWSGAIHYDVRYRDKPYAFSYS
ncbi:MAG: hypothetical protein JWO12_2223, partial [Frankiales bacterium]|nr:hypothetical protein [Frankiales bacterium]